MCKFTKSCDLVLTEKGGTYRGKLGDDLVGSLECVGVVLLFLMLVLHHGSNTVLVLESKVSGWNRLTLAVFHAVELLDMGLVVGQKIRSRVLWPASGLYLELDLPA
jgi:hypothetical protein